MYINYINIIIILLLLLLLLLYIPYSLSFPFLSLWAMKKEHNKFLQDAEQEANMVEMALLCDSRLAGVPVRAVNFDRFGR
jgi:hypothetical protein